MQNVEFAQKTHVGITQTKDLMTSQHREEHCGGKIESRLDAPNVYFSTPTHPHPPETLHCVH